MFDSLALAKEMWSAVKDGCSLASLGKRLNIKHEYEHRALGDCATTLITIEMAFEGLGRKTRSLPAQFDKFKRAVLEAMVAKLESRIPDPAIMFGADEEHLDPLYRMVGAHSDFAELVKAYRPTISIPYSNKHEEVMKKCQSGDSASFLKNNIKEIIEPHGGANKVFTAAVQQAWERVVFDGTYTLLLLTDFEDMAQVLDICLEAGGRQPALVLALTEALYATSPGTYPFIPSSAACGLSYWINLVEPTFPIEVDERRVWNGGHYMAYALACKWFFDRVNTYGAEIKTFGQLESFLANISANQSLFTANLMADQARYFRESAAYEDFLAELNRGKLAVDLQIRLNHKQLQAMIATIGRFLGYFVETEHRLLDGEGNLICQLDALYKKVNQTGHLSEAIAFEVQISGNIKGAIHNLQKAQTLIGPMCRSVFIGSVKDISNAKKIAQDSTLEYWEYGAFRRAVLYFFSAMNDFNKLNLFGNTAEMAGLIEPFVEQFFINENLYQQTSFATYENPKDTVVFKKKATNNPPCTTCESTNTIKDGQHRGKQRYLCNACHKKFC